VGFGKKPHSRALYLPSKEALGRAFFYFLYPPSSLELGYVIMAGKEPERSPVLVQRLLDPPFVPIGMRSLVGAAVVTEVIRAPGASASLEALVWTWCD
jgi:hypothetical protein